MQELIVGWCNGCETLRDADKDFRCKVCGQPLMENHPKIRLEYLRGEIQAGRISYGEIAELQSLTQYIDAGDVELLEWAGVPEFEETK